MYLDFLRFVLMHHFLYVYQLCHRQRMYKYQRLTDVFKGGYEKCRVVGKTPGDEVTCNRHHKIFGKSLVSRFDILLVAYKVS